MLAEIREIEHILLETRPAVTHRRLEELGADAGIRSDRTGHFIHIRSGAFAECRDRIDGGNPLCEKRVGHQLGEFGRPQVRGQNALPRHPAGIDRGQRFHRLLPLRRGFATNQNAVRVFQIRHGGSLCEKLRIGEHLELTILRVRPQHREQGLGGFHGNRAFLHHNLRARRDLRDRPRRQLDVFQIRRPPGTGTVFFRRGSDAHENDIRLADGLLHIRREKQIPPAGTFHDGIQPRFIDRKVRGIPGTDARVIHVRHRHTNVGTFRRNHGHRRPANISSS